MVVQEVVHKHKMVIHHMTTNLNTEGEVQANLDHRHKHHVTRPLTQTFHLQL
jgi:hypothetical protein